MISKVLTFTLCLILSCSIQAQNFQTFELSAQNKTYTLTQDLDPSFMGTYIQGNGKDRMQCELSTTPDASFILRTKTPADATHFEWNLENKESIQWGVLVENDELVMTEVMEYANGQMIAYDAYTIVVQKTNSTEVREWMLYELNGKKYLNQAEKIEVVAENR